MDRINFHWRKLLKTLFLVGFSLSILGGCTDLDQEPLSTLSQASFWNSESDAQLALVGIYNASHIGSNVYTPNLLCLTSATNDGVYKVASVGVTQSGYYSPSDDMLVGTVWQRAYTTIFRANYFLENIDKVSMDDAKRAEMIGEVRFLRAYEYFYMSVLYGGVPLITKTLTAEEANSQSRSSLQETQEFCIDELTQAAEHLPISRPTAEKGRILRAAPLAIKGRLLMIQKKWEQAAETYKDIIADDYHIIDPRYKELLTQEGEDSEEIILSGNRIAGSYGTNNNQLVYHPKFYGGFQNICPLQNLVDAYLMKDGLPIETSPLYDEDNPYENRDPRLYATIFLPGYTEFREKTFPSDVELHGTGLPAGTGYGIKKYVREDFNGDQTSAGDDIIFIRYAEVLLSYLEAKLENGDIITQELLDQTINKVRSREAVKMPPVIETNPDKLREIVRRERRVEFAFEQLIRYMDVRRWGIFTKIMNKQFYGMKITDDPENYSGNLMIETTGKYKGHLKVIDKRGTHPASNALLPIPQSEINVAPNLEQNPGY